MVTRADVAKLAGVSPSVVSYVLLPNSRPVAAKTRARVLAAVEELGYRPNAIAQALRGGPTSSIGLLVPDHTNPFFAELVRAVEDLAFQHSYVLLTGSTGNSAERESRYVRVFLDRHVDALLLVGTSARPELDRVADSGTPVVLLDRVPPESTISTVRTDGVLGARKAVEHLAGRGHRRVGIIAGPPDLAVSDDRVTGWLQAMQARDLTADESLLEHAPFTLGGGHDAAMRMLRTRDGATAVFVSSDVQALGVLAACDEHGIRVPQDLAVVSFDGTELSAYAQPPLTVVQQPISHIAHTAVRRILDNVGTGEPRPTHDTFAPDLIVRESS